MKFETKVLEVVEDVVGSCDAYFCNGTLVVKCTDEDANMILEEFNLIELSMFANCDKIVVSEIGLDEYTFDFV